MTLNIAISRLSVASTSAAQTLAAERTIGACTSDSDRFSLNSNASSPNSSLTSPLSTDFSVTGGSSPAAALACLEAHQSAQSNKTASSTNASSCLSSADQHHHQQQQQQQKQQLQHLALQPQPLKSPLANFQQQHLVVRDGQQLRTKAASLPNSLPIPLRRPSRSEHRQSLSDLGYGKIESYSKLQRLGKGTYATVYLGRSRLSNEPVALKEILKEHDEGAPCTAIREVSLLRLLRHNNIVTLHDICHTPKKLTLVFEYVGPDLYAYMRENNHLLSIHNIRVSTK